MQVRPKHTFESVVEELTRGFRSGAITLPETQSLEKSEVPRHRRSPKRPPTIFVSYSLDSRESIWEFEREIRDACVHAQRRVWACFADASGAPSDLALFPNLAGTSLDARFIVPLEAKSSLDVRLLALVRSIRNMERMEHLECVRSARVPIGPWLLIVDDVAYCRFYEPSQKAERISSSLECWEFELSDYNRPLVKRGWDNSVIKIEGHSDFFSRCELFFDRLWHDKSLTKPSPPLLLDE